MLFNAGIEMAELGMSPREIGIGLIIETWFDRVRQVLRNAQP